MPAARSRTLALMLAAVGSIGAAKPAATTQPGGFIAQVRLHFAGWDADHDGALSEAEIERALDDPAMTGPAGAAIATIRRSYYAYARYRPLTLDRLTATAAAGDAARVPPYESFFAADLKKIDKTNRDLFATGKPDLETLGQGRLGDCFLLAPVGTVAFCQPERMKQMVTVQTDGQYAVHFGNGQTVTLPPPTDAEVAIGANAHNTMNDGVWANVFEKAIGQLLLERQRTTAKFVTPYEIIGVGGSPATPMSILTGHKLRRVGCEDFQKPGKLAGAERDRRLNEMRDALDAAFKSGHLVVGGTADISGGETKVHGLYYDHSYGVLGYDRAADVVHFWNPMGNGFKPNGPAGLENGYPTSHGRFDCPLAEAVMWFGSFSIETDEPAGK